MNVGLLTTSFPRSADDTAGAFVLGFARALAARDHRLFVLAPEPAIPTPEPAWPRVHVRRVPYVRPRALQRTFYGAGALDNLRIDARAWLGVPTFPWALWGAARRAIGPWDAVVSHWAIPCALVAGAVAGHRPHLTVFHSADVHLLELLPGGPVLAATIARGATSLQFVSEDLRRRFLSLLPHRARPSVLARSAVQPMGIDPPAAVPADRPALRASLGLTKFTVLSMGRLVPIKGVDVAIRAVATLPNVELVVAGEGPQRPRLERLARQLGAPVRFVGPLRGDLKQRWLQAVDAFVAPSRVVGGRTEGTPTAVLEAMSAARPVIASRSGGLTDVICAERTGLHVPCDDTGALAAAVARLRDDPSLTARLGRAAHGAATGHHWPAIAPRLERALHGPTRR